MFNAAWRLARDRQTAAAIMVLIKSIGIGIAIAIEATLVRALIVPSVMRLLGTRNWWAPRSLVRLHRRARFSELASTPEAD